jgi:uncharacterized protein (TIGR00251 family)
MLEITSCDGGVRFRIKVVPGASRTRIAGELDGALKLAVAAPPEKGRANRQVVALLAATLGVRATQVRIETGRSSAYKLCSVSGITAEQVHEALRRDKKPGEKKERPG